MIQRKPNRLKNFDYSSANAYFVTVCVYNFKSLFSKIEGQYSVLNESGKMIQKWWLEIETKFKEVKLDEFIIMPNHMHGIVIITDNLSEAGDSIVAGKTDRHTGLSLQNIIGWFKTMSTNEYIRGVKEMKYPPFEKHLWQRSYYDRIIRNEEEFLRIQEYIYYNPLKWNWEKNNPQNIKLE